MNTTLLKYWITSLFMLLVILFASAQTKRALLIGISNYPDPRWNSLSSAADIKYMKEALLAQGFEEKNISLLLDEHATFNNISRALENLGKISATGDIIYFHFSGHGQQIEDDENRDELDGYDEALVPYDASGAYNPVSYEGQNHFRDDKLGQMLNFIAVKVGSTGSLLAVIDACHSGTATRSKNIAIVRGDPKPFASPEYEPVLIAKLDDSKQNEKFFSASPLNAANIVVFSASSPNQVNYETFDADGKGVGSLSYAVARALRQMGDNYTYAEMFNKVKALIQADRPQQIPMMEGNGNQQVFAGKFLPIVKQSLIDHWVSDTSFTFNQGSMHGIYPGTVVNLLNASTRKKEGEAFINFSSPINSTGITTKSFDKTAPYIIEVVTYGVPENVIGVKFVDAKNKHKNIEGEIKAIFKNNNWISLTSPADYMLEMSSKGNETLIELIEIGDGIRWSAIVPAGKQLGISQQQELINVLEAGRRTKFIRNLPDGGPYANEVDVSISYDEHSNSSDEVKIPTGAEYKFTITNKSRDRLYFNIINILSSNLTSILLPLPEDQPQDYSVGAGQTFTVDGIYVDENALAGKEYMRVVLSPRVIDLRPVFDNTIDENKKRNISGAFEQWLNNGISDNKTLSRTRSNGTNEVTVMSAGFIVVKQTHQN